MSRIASKRLFYGYFFLGVFTLMCYHIYGIEISMRFLWGLLVYLIASYAIYWVFSSLFKWEAVGFFHFFVVYVYKVSVFLSVILLLGGGFMYYQNDIHPSKMPLYTLSNGEKTIKFQAMSHIGRKSFYRKVELDISRAKTAGYVLFYEWVRPGTEANKAIFDAALWVQITPELYESFSKLYWVDMQENEDFLGIKNNLDFNIDLSIDEIVELYLKKFPSKKNEIKQLQENDSILSHFWKEDITQDSSNLTMELLKRLSEKDDKQLLVLRYVNKSMLNFIIKHEGLRNFIIEKIGKPDIFSVILDDRNVHIVEEIEKSEHKKIFIIYGLMHFEWILHILQKSDPRWEIIETKYKYPITLPAELPYIFSQ